MKNFFANNIQNYVGTNVPAGSTCIVTLSQDAVTLVGNVIAQTRYVLPIDATGSFSQNIWFTDELNPSTGYNIQVRVPNVGIVYDQKNVPITGASFNLASFVPGSQGNATGVIVPKFETNGTLNTNQILLNIIGGSNITATADANGGVTITGASFPAFPVTSVFGRTGAIVAVSGDYTISQITGGAPLAFPTFTGLVTAASLTVTGNLTTSGTLTDGSSSVGTNGQILSSTVTGTKWIAAAAGFVNPMTTLGDIIYENATPVAARLAGSISATKNFLIQTGNGSISAAPAWGVLASGDVPNNAANTTGTSGGLTGTPAITVGNITSAGFVDFSGGTIKLPTAGGFTPTANSNIGVDSTNHFISVWNGAANVSVATFTPFTALTNNIPKSVANNLPTLTPSLLTDNGTTLIYTGTSGLQLGVAGTTSGVITLAGSTSGSATITAPAVAGTAANPFLFSNGIQLPSGTGLSWNADIFISRSSANVLTVGNAIGASNGTIIGNFSGALVNGTTATTQAALDNSTKIATTAYVDNIVKGVGIVSFRDDFTEGATVAAIAPATSTLQCDVTWQANAFLVNASATEVAGTFLNPGQYQFTTGATGTGDGLAVYRGGASAATLGALGSNGGWEVNVIVKMNQTTLCAMRVGFCTNGQQTNDPPTQGFWVEFDTANVGNTDTDFTWVTNSGTGNHYSIVNAIAADANFHHFRIRSVTAGTILFSVDGGTETSINTNISVSAQMFFTQYFTRTAAAKVFTIDFVSYEAVTGRV